VFRNGIRVLATQRLYAKKKDILALEKNCLAFTPFAKAFQELFEQKTAHLLSRTGKIGGTKEVINGVITVLTPCSSLDKLVI
jgi:hypothetical protein